MATEEKNIRPEKDRIERTNQEVWKEAEEKAKIEGTEEKKEISKEERIVSEAIRREIELMDVDEELRKEAEVKGQKIKILGEEEKIKNLLHMAKEKGVVYAIKVAKSMNDPYFLDIFHDILAREGFYKDFIK